MDGSSYCVSYCLGDWDEGGVRHRPGVTMAAVAAVEPTTGYAQTDGFACDALPLVLAVAFVFLLAVRALLWRRFDHRRDLGRLRDHVDVETPDLFIIETPAAVSIAP